MSYWGKDFFTFFVVLLGRCFRGEIIHPESDEVQIVVLACIGIACAMVGSFLVLRKMAMVANAISHTVLIGVVGAFLVLHYGLGKPFSQLLDIDMKLLVMASLLASLVTMGCTEFLHQTLRLSKDASIGLVFTSLFSAGIVLVTLFTKNTHIGAELIMGNVDMLHPHDIWTGLILVGLNLMGFVLLKKEYVVTSFDGPFAKMVGISPIVMQYVMVVQTSITLVGAFRAVGVVLVLALLVVPPVTARLFVHRVWPMIGVSAGISSGAALIAVALSRHMVTVYDIALSTSGLMVVLLLIGWIGSAIAVKGWRR